MTWDVLPAFEHDDADAGQTTNASNFRFDLNASGLINSFDISAVKARSGMKLP